MNYYTRINAIGDVETERKHLAKKLKIITPVKASSIKFGQMFLANTWKQAAYYDQRNFECNCARFQSRFDMRFKS